MSLFFQNTSQIVVYLLIYVNDIVIIGNDDFKVQTLISTFNNKYGLKYLGLLSYFLGIYVSYFPNGDIMLNQDKYIKQLLARASMENTKSTCTYISTYMTLSAYFGDQFEYLITYRSLIGTLQYIVITRPKIAYLINKISQYMRNPLQPSWHAIKKILRYFQGTYSYDLMLRESNNL